MTPTSPIRITLPNFDAGQICRSGQCFRMTPLGGDRYRVIAGDRWLELCQQGGEVTFSCTRGEYDGFWREYFDLDADYGAVIAAIDPADAYLVQAAAQGSGIRILRQDLWEMIVTFLISQQNNIKRIKKCVETVCARYGRECCGPEGSTYHAFPTPGELAAATEEELRSCGLGYRSRYLAGTAARAADGTCDLAAIRQMTYPQAREALMELPGVGGKVADCICLFALHHLDAFPVDVHIRRALEEAYPEGFPFERYRGSLGILQQYIFFADLGKISSN